MLVLALVLGLALAVPAFAADCPVAGPNGGCAADSTALTSSPGAPASDAGARSKLSRSSKVHSAIAAMVTAIEARKTSSGAADVATLSTKLVRVNDAGEI